MAIVVLVEVCPCLIAGSQMQHGTMQLRPSTCRFTAALFPTAGCMPEVRLDYHLCLTATARIHILQQPKMVVL